VAGCRPGVIPVLRVTKSEWTLLPVWRNRQRQLGDCCAPEWLPLPNSSGWNASDLEGCDRDEDAGSLAAKSGRLEEHHYCGAVEDQRHELPVTMAVWRSAGQRPLGRG
jgi:hypothetical protein